MNEAVLNWLTVTMIGLVVLSALWLAGSVQTTQRAAPYRLALNQAVSKPVTLVAALPAERAASAATLQSVR